MAYALRLGQGVQRACYLAFFNGKTGGTWRSRMTFNRQHAYCNIATILLKEIRTERPMCVCVCLEDNDTITMKIVYIYCLSIETNKYLSNFRSVSLPGSSH